MMQLVALNWHIYSITHSAFALGLIGLLRFVPILIFSLIGGSFADYHNRKKLLFVTQSILSLLSLILAIFTFMNFILPVYIYIITILASITISFDMPARSALIPKLVENKHLANAMSLNSIMFQTAQIVGPTFAGLLIAGTNLGIIYSFNALSFLAVIIGLLLMHVSGEIDGPRVNVSISAIMEGLIFVRSKTIIWSTMLLDFFSTFFSSAMALLPIYAKDILAVGPTGLGLLYAAPSIGAVIAALIVAHKSNLRHQGIVLLASVAVYAFGTVLFGLSNLFIISLLALVIVGAGDSVSTIIRNTIRQLETPDYIRGRMTSVNMIFFMGGPQLGDFEAGVLAGLIGAPLSVITGGLGTFIIVALMAVKIPILRKYSHHR
jgi:MFS family permease